MIRTRDDAPSLRIEIRRNQGRRHVAFVNPATGGELIVAEDLQDSAIDALNQNIWANFDQIALEVREDPYLKPSYGSDLAAQIYLHGFTALQELVKYSPREQRLTVHDVQNFCSFLTGNIVPAPPIIDVVANEFDHIFFEVMPLLGKSESILGSSPDIKEITRSIAGFGAIIRHYELQTSGVTPDPLRISTRFFRHAGLDGSSSELRLFQDLQKAGKMQISLIYPPDGFRPVGERPELELARTLANPWFSDPQHQRSPGSVCHFSCHLKDFEGYSLLELMHPGWRAKPAKYRIDWLADFLEMITVEEPELRLCFLSACKSAAIKRGVLVSAMDVFRRLRPASIVGTLGSVPDLIAAHLAFKFYELLGEGWSIGAALLQSKEFLLEAPYNNPFGLLYVSYHGEDIQFLLPADRRQHFIPDEVSAILADPAKDY